MSRPPRRSLALIPALIFFVFALAAEFRSASVIDSPRFKGGGNVTVLRNLSLRSTSGQAPSMVVDGARRGNHSTDSELPDGAEALEPAALTEAELEKYAAMDIVFTFVNGSDLGHMFKKILAQENKVKSEPPVRRPTVQKNARITTHHTAKSIVLHLLTAWRSRSVISSRDRDNDELRFSIRSLQQFLAWHRGRIVLVTPGHMPTWMNPETVFLSGTPNFAPNSTPPVRKNNRVVGIHQDALLGPEERGTFNTNTIEASLWRIPMLTPMFLHFNDDYFIRRPTNVSHFVNRYGGPVLFFEGNIIRGGSEEAKKIRKKPWLASVFFTNGVVSELLDTSVNSSVLDPHAGVGRFAPRRLPKRLRSRRFFVKHAPFAYCKNMLRYIAERKHGQLHAAAVKHKFRSTRDIVVPFVHHSLILDAPWRGVVNKSAASILLNNEDSCAPATAKIGAVSESKLFILTDDLAAVASMLSAAQRADHTFLALNDAFSKPEVAEEMHEFLSSLFPVPSSFESPAAGDRPPATRGTNSTLQTPIDWQQPLILFVSSAAYVCPILRSLQFGLPKFSGTVHFEVYSKNQTTLFGQSLLQGSGVKFFPCHLRTERVLLHYDDHQEESHAQWFSRVWGENSAVLELQKKSTKDHLPSVIQISSVDAALGQTIALEDLTVRSVGGTAVYELSRPDQIAFIRNPSPASLHTSFPLPYEPFERSLRYAVDDRYRGST